MRIWFDDREMPGWTDRDLYDLVQAVKYFLVSEWGLEAEAEWEPATAGGLP